MQTDQKEIAKEEGVKEKRVNIKIDEEEQVLDDNDLVITFHLNFSSVVLGFGFSKFEYD